MSKGDKTLERCEVLINRLIELKKALNTVNVASNRTSVPAIGAGWSHDPGTGSLHHSVHGIVSPGKQTDGTFRPVHNGKVLGVYPNAAAAGKAMGEHARSLRSLDTNMYNRTSPNMPSDTKMGKPTIMKSNSKQKKYTEEQIAATEEASKLKKTCENTPWNRHNSIPNADAEVQKIKETNPPKVAEDIMAQQLANMMTGRAMLGQIPPRQPTDQEMFGHLVPSEEMVKNAEQNWNGTMNNWLVEAQKPISSRFSSPEEEEAYWASIKVHDKDDGKSGF